MFLCGFKVKFEIYCPIAFKSVDLNRRRIMQTEFFLATVFNLIMNLVYTIIALFIGIFALKIIDKKLLTSVDLEKELKNNNIAVAIFSATILLFVALIVSFGFK
jgi:hypothetical protein